MNQKMLNPLMAKRFQEYPPDIRIKLLSLREIILQTSNKVIPNINLIETLKWGEPSYLPEQPKVGTTVRITSLKSSPNQYGIYFSCQTNLIARFKKKFGKTFKYQGKRAIVFQKNSTVPTEELAECIAMALTYHISKQALAKKK